MVTSIKIKFRPSSVEGKEGCIYIQLIHNRVVRQLNTDYRIFTSEWDEGTETVIANGNRTNIVNATKERLAWDVARLDKVVAQLDAERRKYSADDVIAAYHRLTKEVSLFSFWHNVIAQLKQFGKVRTSETYAATLKSFMAFKEEQDVPLDGISSDLMLFYEAHLKARGVRMNTISFYMRIFRAVYNRAVEKGLTAQNNPFRHVYTGVDKTVKRAIPIKNIKALKELDLSMKPSLDFARDMFIFSFYTRGMSFVDMAYLRKKDLQNGILTYRRRKTGQELTIKWEKCMAEIITKYPKSKTGFLLPIIKEHGNERRQYDNALHLVNYRLKELSTMLKLQRPLTMYVARHSWASAAKAKNVPLSDNLTQRAIAKECADWIRRKVRFKTNVSQMTMPGFLNVRNDEGLFAYMPFNEFTTTELGCERGNNIFQLIQRMPSPISDAYLKNFNDFWQDKENFADVTDAVIENIENVYRENAPDFIYFVTLYNIFNEFLSDISEDVLPNEATGFKSSQVWNKLYNFQKDAALAIINKLETYNGCILADSVGLGKTFTALSVIKYYENRNKSVLVLCPKKLYDNWSTYKSNYRNNPLEKDRLRYDVLFHTDLSRDYGTSNGIDLALLNWGNYDLIVIDKSHNFRNGGKVTTDEEDDNPRENRYLRLMNRVIRAGVKTKVLMLSATPVNNRFNDLKNQLQLAYEGDLEYYGKVIDDSTRMITIILRYGMNHTEAVDYLRQYVHDYHP